MGSIDPNTDLPPAAPDDDDIIVLVTGFGPFKSQYPINPSWEITKALPALLPPSANSPIPSTRKVRVHIHPAPIKVAYATVRELVPELWTSLPRIDYLVHVGMASARPYYSVERRGHRDGYFMEDVDGLVPGDEKRVVGEGWAWEGCPAELVSDVDVDDVWGRWRRGCSGLGVNVRVSEDAGHYLCDFIYYCSLVELWRRGEEKRVVFLHVPVQSDEVAVAKGLEVLVELIRAIVESGEERKGREVERMGVEM